MSGAGCPYCRAAVAEACDADCVSQSGAVWVEIAQARIDALSSALSNLAASVGDFLGGDESRKGLLDNVAKAKAVLNEA